MYVPGPVTVRTRKETPMFGISLGSKKKPLRIAYGRFFHEANAASPLLTERADFERIHHIEGDALDRATTLRGAEIKSFMPHAELTGFKQAAKFGLGLGQQMFRGAQARDLSPQRQHLGM